MLRQWMTKSVPCICDYDSTLHTSNYIMSKRSIIHPFVFISVLVLVFSFGARLQAQPCSGTPIPGNTLASSLNPCPGIVDSFSLQNIATLGTGITFQWYNGSALIAGATNATYTLTIPGSSATLSCEVTCTASGLSATSTPVTVNVATWGSFNCYCVSKASATQDEEIMNVTLNGNSTNPLYANSNACSTVAPGPGSILKEYSNFMTLPPLSNLYLGTTANFSIVQDDCDGFPYFANKIGIWIDFNHNAAFEPSEQVFIETVSATGPRILTGTFTVPATALLGNTAMRIVCTESLSSSAPPSPCGIYYYGETEDYLVNILSTPPICIGTPILGNTLASATTVCSGGTSNLSLQYTPAPYSNYSFQWYQGSVAISGATNATYTATINATQYYYCAVTCLSSGFTGNSSPITILMNQPNSGSSNVTACNAYLWNANTYTTSGNYTATFTNIAGCDSVHTLNLNINNSSLVNITQTSCDYFLLNGILYTSSGNYTQMYTNAAGCDSLIQLQLTINPSTDSLINAVSCNLYALNGQTYTNTGTYTQSYTNAAGCDSIVTLQVSIDTLNAAITINGISITTPNIGAYQWIDCNTNLPIPGATSLNFIPSSSGSYAVVVTTATCVDTSICVTLTVSGIDDDASTSPLHVYPNPTQGIFSIEVAEAGEIFILNTLGETILHRKVKAGKHEADLSAYSKGIYYVKMKQADHITTITLIKE
jgi:hypothetical protein